MQALLNILYAPITDNHVMAFVIGMLAFFPSMLPSALSLKKKPTLKMYQYIKLEDKLWKVPLFYGVLNLVVFMLVNRFLPESLRKYWVIGIIFGFIYPTLGTIGNYAKKAYGIKSYTDLYRGAQLMYIPFYGLIISALVKYMRK